jgi:hypothetical protein
VDTGSPQKMRLPKPSVPYMGCRSYDTGAA